MIKDTTRTAANDAAPSKAPTIKANTIPTRIQDDARTARRSSEGAAMRRWPGPVSHSALQFKSMSYQSVKPYKHHGHRHCYVRKTRILSLLLRSGQHGCWTAWN